MVGEGRAVEAALLRSHEHKINHVACTLRPTMPEVPIVVGGIRTGRYVKRMGFVQLQRVHCNSH